MNMQEKRAAMLSMISDWRSSGKSKKTYCAENGINEATFYYWFSRSKGEDGYYGLICASHYGSNDATLVV